MEDQNNAAQVFIKEEMMDDDDLEEGNLIASVLKEYEDPLGAQSSSLLNDIRPSELPDGILTSTFSDGVLSSALPGEMMKGNGRFMDALKVFRVMLLNQPSGTMVPDGPKENAYFLLNNEQNILRRGKGKTSRYTDDCGAWSTNASCKSHHYIIRGDQLDNVSLKEGNYCKEQKNMSVPLSPQPSEEEVISFKRYYVSLNRCPTYRKRISYIAKCPSSISHLKKLAVVEYIGILLQEGESKGDPTTVSKDIYKSNATIKCSGSLAPPNSLSGKNGKFLDPSNVFQAMLTQQPIGQDIPAGVKENVYFLLDNGQNVTRLANGKRSRYWDDCGSWSVNGKSKYLTFVIRDGIYLDRAEQKDGLYHIVIGGDRVPILPQPTEENLISYRQYHVHLKNDQSYRKRVSLITSCSDSLAHLKSLALVEYLGKLPPPSLVTKIGHQGWTSQTKDDEESVVCSPDIQSVNMEKTDVDKQSRPEEIALENGRFLSADDAFHIMLCRHPIGDSVPLGAKENVCFLIDNGENITRKANGKKSRYSDDYGVWSIKPSSDADHYIIREDGHLGFTTLVKGLYCSVVKGEYIPLDSQPTEDSIMIFNRYRASLKGDTECRKRITTITKCPDTLAHLKTLAVVEYIRVPCKKQTIYPQLEGGDQRKNMACLPENELEPISSKNVIRNHGKFLDGNTIYRVFLQGVPLSDDVVKGRKENLYFLCNIDPNLVVETAGKKCPYTDGSGPWICKPSCKTHRYIVTNDQELDYVDLKDGLYCKDSKGVRIPLDPQPSEEVIITFKRYYGYFKHNPTYKRRVSIVLKCASDKDFLRNLAIVEYTGSMYG